MKISFTKMQGLGNDFIVLDQTQHVYPLSSGLIQALSNRHYGIGCDQILVLESARSSAEDFFYRIFNADGSEVAQCGNGVRCIAKFAKEKKITDKNHLKLATHKVLLQTEIVSSGLVRVNMGEPEFESHKIPCLLDEKGFEVTHRLGQLTFYPVGMGNPHAVAFMEKITDDWVAEVGPYVSEHAAFPEKTNVEFVRLKTDDPHKIEMRVYERGAGETLACGSGACAAAVIAMTHGGMSSPIQVQLLGGELTIEWKGVGHPVWMTGPAEIVFEGMITI